MKYRKLIRQAANKILRKAFDFSGIDERLKQNIDLLRTTKLVGFQSKQLHGIDLATRSEGTVVEHVGTKIVVEGKSGRETFDLANASYLRVEPALELVKFSMDPHE